jgi:hypothetical protein
LWVDMGGLMTASHQPDARWEDWRIALQPIPAFVGWYRENKISGTLLITAFVIVKGYVVARGDITTALGIVRYVGVAGWVVAAVLSSLPTLAAAMLAICFYQILWPLVGRQLANRRQMLVVTVVAFLICAALTPWPVVVAAIWLGLWFGVLQWLFYAYRKKIVIDWIIRIVGGLILLGEGAAMVVMLYAAWLPNEQVKFKKPKVATVKSTVATVKPMVANVLAEDSGGRITLLVSDSRKIIRREYDNVVMITECSFPPHGGLSNIYDAPTPWAWATTPWQHSFGPGPNPPCKQCPGNQKCSANPIYALVNYWLIPLIGVTIIAMGLIVIAMELIIAIFSQRAERKVPIPISKPYGRWPGDKEPTVRGLYAAEPRGLYWG